MSLKKNHEKKWGPLPPVGKERLTLEEADRMYPRKPRRTMWSEFRAQDRKFVPPPVKYGTIWVGAILGGSLALRMLLSGVDGDMSTPDLPIPPTVNNIETGSNPKPNLEYTDVRLKIGQQMLAKVCDGSFRDMNTNQTTIDPLTAPTKRGTLDPVRYELHPEPLESGGFIAKISTQPDASVEWRNAGNEVVGGAPDCHDVRVQFTRDGDGYPYLKTIEAVGNIPTGSQVHKPI